MKVTRRSVIGALVAVAAVAGLSAVMLPLRHHLATATTALVLVVPVVAAVAAGGFASGAFAVVLGFLAYDVLFIRPYGTLTVGSPQNWAALGVYAVVMLVVARVVSLLQRAREEARRREADTRLLLEISEALIADRPTGGVPSVIVATVKDAFSLSSATLLMPGSAGALEVAARAGATLEPADLAAVTPHPGQLSSLGTIGEGRLVNVPLVASGRPLGLLVLEGASIAERDHQLLQSYANQAALALERTALHEQAMRSELLEEVDRWREALLGAVSHDLRTPLASVKAAVSDLRRDDVALSAADVGELLEVIETQSDRLARLVTNLLDMTRISAGALEPRCEPVSVGVVVGDAIAAVGALLSCQRIEVAVDEALPLVLADHVLAAQVLANLLENAACHAPDAATVRVSARRVGGHVELAVEDDGPGVAPEDRERIFLMFNRVSGAGRAGLGLTIAKAFVEAHGESIRAEESDLGGARFVFRLPAVLERLEQPQRAGMGSR